MEAIESTGAIAYTSRLAKREVHDALRCMEQLRPSPYKDALAALAEFAIERDS
jgi:octaprenyl-diphosphate synthase